VYGAALPLNQIIQSGGFPLLSETCRHVADHTNRNKITLGGNICGKIIYREALLPFLLTDSQVVTAGRSGLRQLSIHDLFDPGSQLDQGELLVQVIVQQNDTKKPYVFIKRTKQERIDYPLVSLAALKRNNKLHVAFSGVCAFPFRSQQIEDVLNNQGLSISERASEALTLLPDVILDDINGSSDYREFVLHDLLMETMATLEEV
jgi:CO/xanthine dehydrogenase FAD-binding subunit